MGFLRDQASRLIREKWGSNVDLLAEELFAMFTSDVPVQIDSPVVITNKGTDPPLSINNFGDTDNSIRITKASDPPPVFPELPPLPDFNVGGVEITVIYDDGSGEVFTGDRGDSPIDTTRGTGRQTGGGSSTFPGQVTGGGPGDTYQVNVYEDGLDLPPVGRTVKQLQIAADATIPPGTWTPVSKQGSFYFMQVPVWLTPVPAP